MGSTLKRGEAMPTHCPKFLFFRRNTIWPVFIALALLLTVSGLSPTAWESHVLQGVATESLRGTTQGRQALVGSSAHGILPSLAILTIRRAGLAGDRPWAAIVVAAIAIGGLWAMSWSVLRHRLPMPGPWPLPLVAALLLSPPLFSLSGNAAVAPAVTAAGASLLMLAGWVNRPGLRMLLPAAAALAASALMPADLSAWIAGLLLLWIIMVAAKKETRRRMPATLLLTLLPLVYCLCAWSLLNWLILGDFIFFIRGMGNITLVNGDAALAGSLSCPMYVIAAVLCAAGLAFAIRRGNSGHILIALGGMSAYAWFIAYARAGQEWAIPALGAILVLCGIFSAATLVADWRTRFPVAAALVAFLPLLAVLITREAPCVAITEPAPKQQRLVLEKAERLMLEESPYGRMFVCGYDGLGLLWSQPAAPQAPAPVLDLYLEELRTAYYGQDLYLMVRRPGGRSARDPIFARAENLYAPGLERLVYVADWKDWRLYRVAGVLGRPYIIDYL